MVERAAAVEKTCEICGKKFLAKSNHAKYCGAKCRSKGAENTRSIRKEMKRAKLNSMNKPKKGSLIEQYIKACKKGCTLSYGKWVAERHLKQGRI